MLDVLEDTVESAKTVLSMIDLDHLDGPDAVRVVGLLAPLGHQLVAVTSGAGARAAATDAWRRTGHPSAADWLAHATGTGVGAAKEALATQDRLEDLPEVKDAHRKGELSEQQANEVSKAAKADPKAQKRLVRKAKRSTLKSLKKDCERTRNAADKNPGERRRRIHDERHLRWWKGSDGALKGSFSISPDKGAAVKARVEAEVDRIFKAARQEGRREDWDAYAADALVNLITRQGGQPKAPRWDLVVHIDFQTMLRGRPLPGELCEIAGVGPVPVELIADLEGNPFIKAVIRDGTDIRTVCHFGRHIPAELRTALETRDPVCSVPGCDKDWRLELDHNLIDFANDGPASWWNIDPKCRHHHRQKTHEGYRLQGPPGARKWIGPDGQIISQDE